MHLMCSHAMQGSQWRRWSTTVGEQIGSGSLAGVVFVADALSRYLDKASYAEAVVMPRWSVVTVVEAVTTAVSSA
jgi:hypothetical protein